MFKIVATRRKGRVELSTVPASWESKGKLRWPKRNGDILSKNANSVPRLGWVTFDCILKRSNFVSYEDAEAELIRMLDRTDTEDDTEERQQAVRSISQHADFNAMAQFLVDSAADLNTNTEHQVVEAYGIDGAVYQVLTPDHQQEPVQQSSTAKVCDNNDQNKISNELLMVITQNQEKIMKKLAEISVQLEEMNENRSPFVCTLAQVHGTTQNEIFSMEPITNVTDLERLDNELSDPNIFNKLKEKYSILCCVAEGSGSNCAYRLLDSLFSKEFLCKCSWTGGSRGEEVKIGFKRYKNIIKFFFEMVRYWDSKYSVESNEDFLKSVLRNALKRKDTKNIRKSSKKCKKTPKPNIRQHTIGEVDKVFINNEVEEGTLNISVANPISAITQNSNDKDDEDETPKNSDASSRPTTNDKLKYYGMLNNSGNNPSSASTSKLYATDKVAENKTLNFSDANSAEQNINNNDYRKNVSSIKNKTDVSNNPNIVKRRRRIST